MLCAAILGVPAVAAKLNANQIPKGQSHPLPVSKLTAQAIGMLIIGSAVFHTLHYEGS